MVKLLLNKGVDVNKLHVNGSSALLMRVVVRLESVDTDASRSIVEDLISSSASLEVADTVHGARFIHFAVMLGKRWLVERLCHAKVEVDSKLPNGFTALHIAITNVLDGTDEAGASIEAAWGANGAPYIHLAADDGNMWLVDCRCRAGVEVDSKLANGSTALHLACLHYDRGVVELLIAAGADINCRVMRGVHLSLIWFFRGF